MIQANELRIGNWLTYPNSKPFMVDIPDFKDGGSLDEDLEIIEPILLTHEILENAGFVKSQTFDKMFLFGNNIAISTADDILRVIKGNFVCQIILTEIQYLHQLQNLIFALTGKELEIKL